MNKVSREGIKAAVDKYIAESFFNLKIDELNGDLFKEKDEEEDNIYLSLFNHNVDSYISVLCNCLDEEISYWAEYDTEKNIEE